MTRRSLSSNVFQCDFIKHSTSLSKLKVFLFMPAWCCLLRYTWSVADWLFGQSGTSQEERQERKNDIHQYEGHYDVVSSAQINSD